MHGVVADATRLPHQPRYALRGPHAAQKALRLPILLRLTHSPDILFDGQPRPQARAHPISLRLGASCARPLEPLAQAALRAPNALARPLQPLPAQRSVAEPPPRALGEDHGKAVPVKMVWSYWLLSCWTNCRIASGSVSVACLLGDTASGVDW
jgi:hypothetical protein